MRIPFINDLKIRSKIGLVPIPAAIAFALILIVNSYLGTRNTELISQIDQKLFPALETGRQLEETLTTIQNNMQYASSTMDATNLNENDKLNEKYLNTLDKCRVNNILTADEIQFLDSEFRSYYPLAKKTTLNMITGGTSEQVITDLNTMQSIYNGIQKKLEGMITAKKAEMTASASEANNNQSNLFMAIIIIMILSIFWQAVFTIFFTRSITTPLNKMVIAANEMAKGGVDIEVQADSKDEIGELAKSMETVLGSTKALAKAADAIGQGNYDIKVDVRSETDILGNAISHMQKNLLKMTRENERQNWLKTGLANLSEKLRGDQDVTELAQNVVRFISEYLGALVGAIYLLENRETLQLSGSYAFKRRKGVSNMFKAGEGLVGQAALERQTIVISDVPDDYIQISSGLGEAQPANIIVCPLIYDNEIAGVIELGTFTRLDDFQVHFLEQATESIAIAFHSAIARKTVEELLDETQNQAAELQAQQEELRVTNEELEEQTVSLKESEDQLRKQQEELQTSNEELERQTEVLKERQSELEKARYEIEQKAKQLEESSKYKSEFLANMSHELRTPLNSIQILSRLLIENKNGKLDEKQVNYARTIHSSGADLLDLINEILDLSKIEAGKMIINLEKMPLEGLAIYLKNNFEHQTSDKGLYFNVNISPDIEKSIITDRQRVEQILKNLISNAIKFTENGGLTIEMYKPEKNVPFQNADLKHESTIAISVSDTGIGISKENLNKIFEAFQQEDGTTSRKYGGTGLGLSISVQLVRLLGGEVKVESEQGKGSTFFLFIPVKHPEAGKEDYSIIETHLQSSDDYESAASVSNEIRDDRHDLDPDSQKVLIIEDNCDFAQILFNFARDRGYKCLVACDGEAGLQMAYQYHPHAILLDVGLPRMDGWQVIDKLKSNPATRQMPVFFISGQDMKVKAMQKGALGTLNKTVNKQDLEDVFKKIEATLSGAIKKVLLVEDDTVMRSSMVQLIKNDQVEVLEAEKGKDALKILETEQISCIVLDLGLSDISGFDLVEKIKKAKYAAEIPIIIYTGKELSKTEQKQLLKYSESIIIKGVKSTDRLLDEVSLFLHTKRTDSSADHEAPATRKIDKTKFENKKVLIADDDVRNIYALTSILENEGIRVIVAENGMEAVEMVESNPDTSLILMDIMMPGMDGYEAIKRIRDQKVFSQLPIITLTAKAMKGDRQKCIEAGANDYLSKPLDVEKLLSLLQIWMSNNN